MPPRSRARNRGGRTTVTTTTTTAPGVVTAAPMIPGIPTVAPNPDGSCPAGYVKIGSTCVKLGEIVGTPVIDPGVVAGGVGSAVTGWIADLFKIVLPILKVTAGGAGLLVSGIALVYVAGRNTAAGRAVTGGTGAISGTARNLAAPAVRARAPERQVKAQTRSRARSDLAAARVETRVRPSGRERTRIVSRRAGRANLEAEAGARAAEREGSARQRTERGTEIGSGLGGSVREVRRRTPKVRHR